MARFETTASAWGSVLSSEALNAYTQSTRNIVKTTSGAKLAWAESGAEAVVSKRAYTFEVGLLIVGRQGEIAEGLPVTSLRRNPGWVSLGPGLFWRVT